MAELPQLRRRDFLLAALAGAGGLVALKVGGRLAFGPAPTTARSEPLTHLGPRQEAIVTAVALAFLGEAAAAAHAAGTWDPAAHVDRTLGLLEPDQRQALGLGIHLLEEWTLGLTGFTGLSRDEQVAFLARWRTSGLALHRTVWGALHALTVSSFAATEAGSRTLMGHPGSPIGAGRPPGQSVSFEWDEAVP